MMRPGQQKASASFRKTGCAWLQTVFTQGTLRNKEPQLWSFKHWSWRYWSVHWAGAVTEGGASLMKPPDSVTASRGAG